MPFISNYTAAKQVAPQLQKPVKGTENEFYSSYNKNVAVSQGYGLIQTQPNQRARHKISKNNHTIKAKMTDFFQDKDKQDLPLEASSNERANHTSIASQIPPQLIKVLMHIAETCVIKSHRIGNDEVSDFVQNCLLKLLLQIEQHRVVIDNKTQQYFILRKDNTLLEIERWFGTTATNVSIDHYRRLKKFVDIDSTNDEKNTQEDNLLTLFAPEPSVDLEEAMQQQQIKDMAAYCASTIDDCIFDAWNIIANDNYTHFSLSFTEDSTHTDKGIAVANYCQIIISEKYNHDGKKRYKHETACDMLGIHIRPENIAHKKKKFEQIMMKCVSKKVDKEFNSSTKEILQGSI